MQKLRLHPNPSTATASSSLQDINSPREISVHLVRFAHIAQLPMIECRRVLLSAALSQANHPSFSPPPPPL